MVEYFQIIITFIYNNIKAFHNFFNFGYLLSRSMSIIKKKKKHENENESI
jgi:hypothetical protein